VRIAVVQPETSGARGSEVARIAHAQARELARRGHELTFCAGAGAREVGDAQVVHVFFPGAGAQLDLAGLARRAAVMLFLHEGWGGSELAGALALVDRVVLPSRAHLVRLGDGLELGPCRLRLLDPGVDLELPAARRRPQPWSGRGPLRLLLVGARRDARGFLALVRALTLLPEGAVELYALGPGDAQIDRLAAGLAGPAVLQLLGELAAAELARLAARCHLAVFPSTSPESYALDVDVAVALGLPVWASGAEAALERFGAGALELLPAGEAEPWAAALHAWLGDPARSRDAHRLVPDTVPTAAGAAQTLERWDQELLSETRDRLRPPHPRRSA